MKNSAFMRRCIAALAAAVAIGTAPALAQDLSEPSACLAAETSESQTPVLDVWEKAGRHTDPLCISEVAEALRREGETSPEAYARLVDMFAVLVVRSAGVDRSCYVAHGDSAPPIRVFRMLRASRKALALERRENREAFAAAVTAALDRPDVWSGLPIAEGCSTQAELLEEEPEYFGVKLLVKGIANVIAEGGGVGIFEASSQPDAKGTTITYTLTHQLTGRNWDEQNLVFVVDGVRHNVALPLEKPSIAVTPRRVNLYETPDGDYGLIRAGWEVFTISRTTFALTAGAGQSPDSWRYTGAFDTRLDRAPVTDPGRLSGRLSHYRAEELPECLGNLVGAQKAPYRAGAWRDCLPDLYLVQAEARKGWIAEVNAGREPPDFVNDGRVRIAPMLAYAGDLELADLEISASGDRVIAQIKDPAFGPGGFLIDPATNRTLAIMIGAGMGGEEASFNADGSQLFEWAAGSVFVRHDAATGAIAAARQLPFLNYSPMSDDGHYLLSEGGRGVGVFDTQADTEMYRIGDAESGVISGDGQRVAVSGETGGDRLYETLTGKLISKLAESKGDPHFTSDSARLYLNEAGRLQVYDADSGRLLWTSEASAVSELAGTRHFLVTPAEGKPDEVRDGNSGAVLKRFDRLFLPIASNGHVLVGALKDGGAAVWDVKTFDLRHILPSLTGDARYVVDTGSAISPDGRWIARGVSVGQKLDLVPLASDGTPAKSDKLYLGPGAWLGVWDAVSGERMWLQANPGLPAGEKYVDDYVHLTFSRDGRRLMFCRGERCWMVELPASK
ncbi:WD40 repeat domain-containing protein [Asticcacaulis sp. AC402]|uniref:WD40 repeat domain-containing protein n=1 Tax=Asticcacaulis sp. AC402 TaxID=1282361 RepID=UPI0003C3D707|nr:WD40 repeat domain-containing protein [Asticcacaulis sp. AC402]ESQ73951.1 hypothetical protein ABAC402_16425 [Asticcacaulis sp. AC402]